MILTGFRTIDRAILVKSGVYEMVHVSCIPGDGVIVQKLCHFSVRFTFQARKNLTSSLNFTTLIVLMEPDHFYFCLAPPLPGTIRDYPCYI
jgi:hypothetical protein